MKRSTTPTRYFLPAILSLSTALIAQMPSRPVPAVPPVPSEDFTWWYLSMAVMVIGLAAAVGWWYKTKFIDAAKNSEGTENESVDSDSLDADAELAWLKSISKKKAPQNDKSQQSNSSTRAGRSLSKNNINGLQDDSRSFEETKKKLKKIQFSRLPVNSFESLKPPKPFEELPISSDDALMSAIEQTHCEDEDDAEIRELAVRILARFKTKNALEALSQTAMYDVSSALRSKAVGVLASFDHESVFESILLCCADPTREVRAAAARALFNLSFDRADAWARIAECGDEFRMVQAARAAIESDLVERSIERLIHEDVKHSYEAFALIALLIRAGETMEIFQILESHANQFVKLGLLRVFKVIPDERTIPVLISYMERNTLPEDLGKAVNECIRAGEPVPV